MAVFKCKMCGGNLIPSEDGYGVCDSCGLSQTLTDQNGFFEGFDKYLSFGNESEKKTDGRIETLVKRAFLFLEDGKWKDADEYFEKILDIDPEYAPVYLGKLMIEYRVTKPEYLSGVSYDFGLSTNYHKAVRYGDGRLKKDLADMRNQAKANSEEVRYEAVYNNALNYESKGDEKSLESAIELFKSIYSYRDSSEHIAKCEEKLQKNKKAAIAKSTGVYIATGVFIIIKLICSCIWASKLNPLVAAENMTIAQWIGELLHVIGLMALEVILTATVCAFASKCKVKDFRMGGIIMLVLTFIESFLMSVIDNPQVFSDIHRKVFVIYLIFSLVCNFSLYILMLIFSKIKKAITK